jgi:tellurite resistance protein TerB
MGFFNKLKGKVKKIENKNLLEAVVAGCVWASASDGIIDDSEIAKIMEVIECNPGLKHFGPEIGKIVSEMIKAFSASIQVGRTQAMRKIRTVVGNDQDCEDVVAAILSVVAADGKIGTEEEKVVQAIAKELRVDLNQFA